MIKPISSMIGIAGLALFGAGVAHANDVAIAGLDAQGKICAKPSGWRKDRCKPEDVRDKTPPANQDQGLLLSDAMRIVSQTTTAAGENSTPGSAYVRLQFRLEGSETEVQSAFTAPDGWFRRFRPQARAIALTVAATNNDAPVLGATELVALKIPMPSQGVSARTARFNPEVTSPWMRVEAGTQLRFRTNLETFSDSRLDVFGQVFEIAGGLNKAVTGDNLFTGLANSAVIDRARAVDSYIANLVDATPATQRSFGGELAIRPQEAGQPNQLVLELGDRAAAGRPVARIRVSVQYARTLLDTTPQPTAREASLRPLEPAATLSSQIRVPGKGSDYPAKTYREGDQFQTLAQKLDSDQSKPAEVCAEFDSKAASLWGLTRLDRALLIYEALSANLDPAAALEKRQRADAAIARCLPKADQDQLAALGRTFDRGPPIAPVGFSRADWDGLGGYLLGRTPQQTGKTTLEKFQNAVTVTYATSGLDLSGDTEPGDIIAALQDIRANFGDTAILRFGNFNSKPTRFSMRAQTPGRALRYAVIELDTASPFDKRIGRLTVRDAKPDEVARLETSIKAKDLEVASAAAGATAGTP